MKQATKQILHDTCFNQNFRGELQTTSADASELKSHTDSSEMLGGLVPTFSIANLLHTYIGQIPACFYTLKSGNRDT